MNTTTKYLPGQHPRAQWMRMDAAGILKRFFFLERALVVAQSGWLASIAPVPIKTGLPEFAWQDAETADDLRERIFELRFPSRLMEVDKDAALVNLYQAAIHAPSAGAFLLGLQRVLKPALRDAYRQYLTNTDAIADGPTLRFIRLAEREKTEQIEKLGIWAAELLEGDPAMAEQAERWAAGLQAALDALGGVSLEPQMPQIAMPELPEHKPFALAQDPARDERFNRVRFYWPDIVDPNFAYGEGINLQMRSAISHFNEVWAVETAGAILHAFADELGWDFIHDAAHWAYDEARHTQMGLNRLIHWGFDPAELPLGDYIYQSAHGEDPIYRLGMLFFFETKNIGHKNVRIKAFTEYNDEVSRHDMDYDWADETIHASYGAHWLGELLKNRPEKEVDEVRAYCGELVAKTVATCTDQERAEIRSMAEKLLVKASSLA
ncbi:MAG: DUF455 family protein [Anaerolineales bacterium]|nr:DUF455 family protein [Anaerolineales bacterium]MCW5854851.1 DUF455 family protein [Anaerolineales bacterium]